MKIIFTSNRQVIDAMVNTLHSVGYDMKNRIELLGHTHYVGYSTIGLELKGELTDLIFLGINTQATLSIADK
jgi:hypothetical protein